MQSIYFFFYILSIRISYFFVTANHFSYTSFSRLQLSNTESQHTFEKNNFLIHILASFEQCLRMNLFCLREEEGEKFTCCVVQFLSWSLKSKKELSVCSICFFVTRPYDNGSLNITCFPLIQIGCFPFLHIILKYTELEIPTD